MASLQSAAPGLNAGILRYLRRAESHRPRTIVADGSDHRRIRCRPPRNDKARFRGPDKVPTGLSSPGVSTCYGSDP